MKVKTGKTGHEYYASIHTGRGGVSSLVNYRQGRSIWKVLGVFSLKNLWVGVVGKHRPKQ